MVKDLIKLGIWNKFLKNEIIANNGSIQTIPQIPDDIKLLYRTVWEIPQKSIIEMSADRGNKKLLYGILLNIIYATSTTSEKKLVTAKIIIKI